MPNYLIELEGSFIETSVVEHLEALCASFAEERSSLRDDSAFLAVAFRLAKVGRIDGRVALGEDIEPEIVVESRINDIKSGIGNSGMGVDNGVSGDWLRRIDGLDLEGSSQIVDEDDKFSVVVF